jgi:sulfatase modifying factor 1
MFDRAVRSMAVLLGWLPAAAQESAAPAAFEQSIPGSTATLRLVPIPAATGTGADGEPLALGGHWISTTEVPWEVFDAFVFEEFGAATPPGVDALARPTKPYITADRGFGHDGYPAGSLSLASAQAFCDWLSFHTGRVFRLPSEAEWTHAALGGATGPWHHGTSAEGLGAVAWFRDNARRKTHPVGSLAPNGYGLFDVHGNVAEWATSADGRGRLCGGSYLDRAAEVAATARLVPSAAWNQSDPNLPKSPWWLADGPFAGFRLLCETAPPATQAPDGASPR